MIQREAIDAFAAKNGFDVVASYEDEGRSGIDIANRPGLRRLLRDVAEKAAFSEVLVYDVSRWGRFQDADAAAYYEYHCRLHGVRVIYVNESFANDLAPTSVLLKSMRRVMAAEYSRDIASKARAGQTRVIAMGFHMGALPPLGYRRCSVSADGKQRLQLIHGQRKCALTDRIEWVLAPEPEVALVRRICEGYACGMQPEHIASLARAEGWRTVKGRAVTTRSINTLVRHEALIGNFVWGVKSKGGKILKCEPTRFNGSVPRIVDDATWNAIQARLKRREMPEPGEAVPCTVSPTPTRSTSGPTKQLRFRFFNPKRRSTYRQALGEPGQLQFQTRDFGKALSDALANQSLPTSFDSRGNVLTFWNASLRIKLMWPCDVGEWELGRRGSRSESEYFLVVRMAGVNQPIDYFIVPQNLFQQFPQKVSQQVPRPFHRFWFKSPDELVEGLTRIAMAE